jgi:hypothetical protein
VGFERLHPERDKDIKKLAKEMGSTEIMRKRKKT